MIELNQTKKENELCAIPATSLLFRKYAVKKHKNIA